MYSSWIGGCNGELAASMEGFYTHKSFIYRVEPTQLAFVILGASMAALALMILVTAILATGATRWDFLDVFCFFHDFLQG